jgi:hypothetical protein
MDLLLWLEDTGIANWVGESNSILAYPSILFLHTLGLATVAGLSAVVCLRVLGYAAGLPLTSLRPFVTAIWAAFGVTAFSGTLLLIAAASSKVPSPIFLIKMLFVALAVVTLHVLTKRVIRNPQADQLPVSRQAHTLAATSLLLWVAATTAGRLMAYLG